MRKAIVLPEYGGQARSEGKCWNGAPELVVEIRVTSTEVDFGPRLALNHQSVAPGEDENYRPRVFPGLWLNTAAFWAGDGLALATLLQEGLATDEHAAFADQLNA